MSAPGVFAEVAPLVDAGRFAEAARALRRSAASGTQAWEMLLWLGRIEEGRGRWDRAEDAYRRCAAAHPGSPMPRLELSRFLEKRGRTAEAQDLLRETASQAAGELTVLSEDFLTGGASRSKDESLYALMEFNLYRRAFLEAVLRDRAGLPRIEAALRSVLAAVPQPGARTLLAEVLLARGRPAAAERELAAAFAPGAAGAETSRIEVLFRLADRGRYGRALEAAVLGALSRADASDKLAVEWPQLFSALMCARLYPAAFRLAEAMLDKFGRLDSPTQFLWPWWRKIRRAVAEDRFIRGELARLRAASRGGEHPHWYAYYRAVLLGDAGRNREALAESRLIAGLDPERYAWMIQSFVLVRLSLLDFDGAVSACRAVLDRAPSHWWVRCRMAEALLARGETGRALGELARAEATCDAAGKKEVLTWHGEILLWRGDYEAALAKLDAAVALGARNFVFGWRGAARLLLGRPEEALADLDRAVRLDAKDHEALCWRGEAYRLLGRAGESRRDLEAAIAASPDDFWAKANLALLLDSLGDKRALRKGWRAVPKAVRAFVAAEAGARRPGPGRAATRRLLQAALALAQGVRRWEAYAQRIWMEARA